ncbi:PapG chaperone-binding domain-containing protein [Citrobacter sp. FP75]|uniref:PapG chaperone-binding domain-containing protein n=1 Tax=Citrobacter sp. FP75 TaxID=1852949 RepID=UPI001BCA063B|nr:PapG chaperone-binding domain-containing protein [Citrobacter sp. FP75]
MRFLFLCAFIASQFSTPVHADYIGTLPHLGYVTYGFFWTAPNDGFEMGRLEYNGNAISSIPVALNSITPGNLYLKAKFCKTSNFVSVDIEGLDYYLFLPKKISANGVEIPISIGQTPSDTTVIDRTGHYALYKKIEDRRMPLTQYRCYADGHVTNYGPVAFDSSLLLDVRHLGVGHYTGSIPMRIGFASYYSSRIMHQWLSRWPLDSIDDISTTQASLPFDITINNKCEVFPSKIELSHGGHSISSADGHTTSSSINIKCQLPSDVKFKLTLKSLNTPTTEYSDGVGVGLGNGWDSVLTVENTNISASSPSADITISGNGNLTIQSVLKKTASSQPGNLSGAAVMEISIP